MKIEEIAKIVGVDISQEDYSSIEEDFNQKLSHLEKIFSLKTEPLTDDVKNVTRDDVVVDYPKKEEIISTFKEREGNYLKVKKILND